MNTIYRRAFFLLLMFIVPLLGYSQLKKYAETDFTLGNRCIEKYYETDSLSYVYRAISYWDSCIKNNENIPEANISKCIWLCELKMYEEAEQVLEAVPDSVIVHTFGDTYKYATNKLFKIMQNVENRHISDAISNAKEAFDFLEAYMNEHKIEVLEYIKAYKLKEHSKYNYFSFLTQYVYFYSLVNNPLMARVKLMEFYDNMNGEMSEELYLYLKSVLNHDITHFNGLI